MYYLMNASSFQELKKMKESSYDIDLAEFEKASAFYDVDREGYRVENTVAFIEVSGVLTKEPDLFTELFFGNTTYSSIIADLTSANQDPAVKSISLMIDSPGGDVSGLFETLDTVWASEKPVTAYVGSVAASAAYAIASQADLIVAESRGSMLGSVGVVGTFHTDPNVIEVTSTEAPNKRPDVSTEEGVSQVRTELDEIHDLFVEAISRGRETNTKTINCDYGRGSTFMAQKAMDRGMIDQIGIGNNNHLLSTIKMENKMDLMSLEREFPEVYAECITLGIDTERERVLAHIELGRSCDAIEHSLEAIEEGAEFGPLIQAKYLAKSIKSKQIAERETETAKIPAVDALVAKTTDAESDAMKVALMVKQQFRKK